MSAPPPARPDVVLAVPVHDEGARLSAFLGTLVERAPTAGATVRVVVVDDGSAPPAARLQAAAVAEASRRLARAGSPHSVALLVSPSNEGKGAAIRRGWGEGEDAAWLGFVDGDGAVPAHEVWRLVDRLAGAPAFDVLAAGRLRGVGRQVRRTVLRDLQGRAFARMVEAVLGLGLRDPQCGLKFFRAARLLPVLPGLRERRWLLDLELLALLVRGGAVLEEQAIDWQESGRSAVLAGVDPVRMALGLLRLRARLAWAPLASGSSGGAAADVQRGSPKSPRAGSP